METNAFTMTSKKAEDVTLKLIFNIVRRNGSSDMESMAKAQAIMYLNRNTSGAFEKINQNEYEKVFDIMFSLYFRMGQKKFREYLNIWLESTT